MAASKGGRRAVALGMWLWLLLLVGGFGSVSMSGDCSVELYDKIYNQSLAAARTPWAMVEFFASWCQACQNYKPHFERVACLFNEPNAVHGDEVYVTKVDCGIESNNILCERFGIESIPTLYWGPPKKLASGGGSPKAKLGLESFSGGTAPTSEDLLQWINKRIEKGYSLTDTKPIPQYDSGAASELGFGNVQMAATLHDVEEATARAFEVMMDEKPCWVAFPFIARAVTNARESPPISGYYSSYKCMQTLQPTSRASFLQFLHLLDVHHPSKRCRKGSAELLVTLEQLWPRDQPPTAALRKRQLCGKGLPRGSWISCHGEDRGYSCGLWMLFHTLTVRVEDFESGFARAAIEAFVSDFFICEGCRDHFLDKPSRTSPDTALTSQDVVLWLWRTHNKINKLNADAPKQLWPTGSECPQCRRSTLTTDEHPEWNETAVYAFLMDWYGPSLKGQLLEAEVGSGRAAAVSSTAAPFWGIAAMAGCGLGLATCFCRLHSKKLKFARRRS